MSKTVQWIIIFLLILITIELFFIHDWQGMQMSQIAEIQGKLESIQTDGITPQRIFDGDFSMPEPNGDRYDRYGQKYDENGVPYGK
jgi:hypothetical protein